MLKALLEWDRQTFLYLNSLGAEPYDGFWSIITEFVTWLPFFVALILLFFKKFPKKEALRRIACILVLSAFIALLTHLVKEGVGRLRPNNDETIAHLTRVLKHPTSYSFFSGHAASSFSIALLAILLLRNKFRWSWLFFIWPVLFALSRIYVGVHYPLDILVGMLVGLLTAYGSYRAYLHFTVPGT